MTDEGLINEAGRRLSNAAPEADIILFGSRARGEASEDSDLDLQSGLPLLLADRLAGAQGPQARTPCTPRPFSAS
jgi:hypothetical protein